MKAIYHKILLFLQGLNQRPVIAIMATVVSICALCVSLYQTQLSRQQQLAAVWPYLSIGGYGTANGNKQSWGVRVVNNGLGPAIIESVTVRYAGQVQPFQVFTDSLYAKNVRLDALKSLNYAVDEIKRGEVIAAGSTVEWISFELDFSKKLPGNPSTLQFLPNLEMLIQYTSLYGERWTSCFNCPDGKDGVHKLD